MEGKSIIELVPSPQFADTVPPTLAIPCLWVSTPSELLGALHDRLAFHRHVLPLTP